MVVKGGANHGSAVTLLDGGFKGRGIGLLTESLRTMFPSNRKEKCVTYFDIYFGSPVISLVVPCYLAGFDWLSE